MEYTLHGKRFMDCKQCGTRYAIGSSKLIESCKVGRESISNGVRMTIESCVECDHRCEDMPKNMRLTKVSYQPWEMIVYDEETKLKANINNVKYCLYCGKDFFKKSD